MPRPVTLAKAVTLLVTAAGRTIVLAAPSLITSTSDRGPRPSTRQKEPPASLRVDHICVSMCLPRQGRAAADQGLVDDDHLAPGEHVGVRRVGVDLLPRLRVARRVEKAYEVILVDHG